MADISPIDIRQIAHKKSRDGTHLIGRKADMPVQICETQGVRPEQQDRYFITPCTYSGPTNVRARLESAFVYANERTKHKNSGSCATVVVASPDRNLTVASLGDSPAVLYVMDGNKHVTPYPINHLHKPNDIEEYQWIEDHGGTVTQYQLRSGGTIYRINEDLATSRALGDWRLGDIIRRTPSITQIKLDDYLKPGDTAFLCVSCDGFFEKGITPQEYAEIIHQAALSGKTSHVAELMKDYAIARGSEDNLTVLFTRIPKQLSEDIVMGICDGHGTNDAAKQACLSLRRDLESDRMLRPQDKPIPLTPPLSTPETANSEALSHRQDITLLEGAWKKTPKGEYHLLVSTLNDDKKARIAKQLSSLGIPVINDNPYVWRVEKEGAGKIAACLFNRHGR